jgi:hypothetical protein
VEQALEVPDPAIADLSAELLHVRVPRGWADDVFSDGRVGSDRSFRLSVGIEPDRVLPVIGASGAKL